MADNKRLQKIKGVHFCGSKGYCYIIRTDLGYYMKAKDLHKGSDLSIHALHPICRHGDHYLSDNQYFYIIKGDEYRRVTNLTEGTDSSVNTLHSSCQGGDHYLKAKGKFYIFPEINDENDTQKKYKSSKDLTAGWEKSHEISDIYKDGLYYWGDKKHLYVLKNTKWGVEYYKVTDLDRDVCTAVYSVHPDVLNFLPGGLSITNGPAFGKWVKIKTVSNDSPTPVKWLKKVTKRVGYNKEKMSEITHNWKIEASVRISTGKLAALIADAQFTLMGGYAHSRVSTEKEMWTEETVEEEQLSFQLDSKKCLYVWQYQLCFGSEPVLFYRNLKITDKPNRPTEVPITRETSPLSTYVENTDDANPLPEVSQSLGNSPIQQRLQKNRST